MAITNLGDYPVNQTVGVPFHTFESTNPAASVTITDFATADIAIYKDFGVTQRASSNGIEFLDDAVDFDGITGVHAVQIKTNDNSDAGFYAAGSDYWVRIGPVTCDEAVINFWAAIFSIDNRGLLRPTTAQQTLNVSAGRAGINWADVNNTSVAVALTATDIKSVTGSVGKVLGNVSGSVSIVTGSVASVVGAVGSVTGDVGGNLVGNVGGTVMQVTGSVGKVLGNVSGSVSIVTGSVASVVGAVGSVTGDVGGNVVGNVGGTVASVSGSVGSVTGNVGGTVASVTGAVASATSLGTAAVDAIWDEDVDTSHQTAGTAGKKLDSAGAAGDPWDTSLPAAYAIGTAGNLIGAKALIVAQVTGSVGSVTGDVDGNVNGSVGSVTGAIASVTTVTGNVGGTVASVSGSVASVAGDVDGNVNGSVGSVTGAVASVTGDVGGNVNGSVGSVTGAVGSVTGNVGGAVVGAVASVTGDVGGNLVGNVGGTVAQVTGSVADILAISGSTEAADNLEASAETIVGGTASGTISTTVMDTNLTEATNDHYNGRIIIWTAGALQDQATAITDYTGATKTLTFTAVTEACATGNSFIIV